VIIGGVKRQYHLSSGTEIGGGRTSRKMPSLVEWAFFECMTIVLEELNPIQKHVFRKDKMIVDYMML
jgi:hypothetical protein